MQTNRMRRGFVAALAVLALCIACLGGMPAGFTLGMGGAQVVGICEILTQSGTVCPARDAGLNVGDVIVQFNGMEIRSAEDMDSALACSDGTKAAVLVKSGETRVSKQIVPAKDMTSGKYKLGILIRDSISGIGTVTYIDPQSRRFGSLGHAVSGEDGALMSLVGGNMYHCSIVSVIRGERGKAGELKGLFLGENRIGTAEKNCETGIYGRFDESYDLSCLQQVPVSGSAAPGKASIYTTINGTSPCEYSISIVKVDAGNGKNKNFVLKVTDERLLSETGGIVQGMSGSPILQGGKLIGAVTHVFLNDPTRGYGIAIERMLANG